MRSCFSASLTGRWFIKLLITSWWAIPIVSVMGMIAKLLNGANGALGYCKEVIWELGIIITIIQVSNAKVNAE